MSRRRKFRQWAVSHDGIPEGYGKKGEPGVLVFLSDNKAEAFDHLDNVFPYHDGERIRSGGYDRTSLKFLGWVED